MLTQLQHVRVHDAELVVVDQSIADTLRADIADLDLARQHEGGVRALRWDG